MRTELILDPGRLQGVPVYTLLESAAHGYLHPDHRFLHAILDRGADAVPDLVRFASADHSDEPVDIEPVLVDLFHVLATPEAIPFLIDIVRREPEDLDDDLITTIANLGAAAVDPLLALLDELGDNIGDVPFLLSILRVRDPRILEAFTKRLGSDADVIDLALCLDVYGDPAAIPALQAALDRYPAGDVKRSQILAVIESLQASHERQDEAPGPFDIWDVYAVEEGPPFEALDDDEILAMLESESKELKIGAAKNFRNEEAPLAIRARLLELARTDHDVEVRAECWEGLADASDEPEVRKAMLGILKSPGSPVRESAGVAVALAMQVDNPTIYRAIVELYEIPQARAKALKAMARSLDRRFADYPPRHLDDADRSLQHEAIWGVGYLNLSSEAGRLVKFFDDDEFRTDALFAYALSVPGETSSSRVHALLRKVDELSGGFRPGEEELVQVALDQRLMMHGKKPVFNVEEDDGHEHDHDHGHHHHSSTLEIVPPADGKPGRNDPCPCGSGKKYKKCCGA